MVPQDVDPLPSRVPAASPNRSTVGSRVRIGLFSDVHGNLSALRAVLAALADEGPLDHVAVAGDLLQGGPRPREVWELLTARHLHLVRGNEDESLVGAGSADYQGDPQYRNAFLAGTAWTRAQVDPHILGALMALPTHWRLATPSGDLLVVHASPRSITDRAGGAHNSAAEVAAAYDGTGARAIAFGHYHRNLVRQTPFALLINVASVGLPRDKRPLASYTILTSTPDGWIVEQRQVPYDEAEEAAVAADRGMPLWTPDPI